MVHSLCEYPCLTKMWYDFEQSDTINVPSTIQSFMMGNSVALLRSSTATRKHLLASSFIPSKTHCLVTLCPQWYFRFQPCFHQFEPLSLHPLTFHYFSEFNFTWFPAKHIPVDSFVGINVQLLLNLLCIRGAIELSTFLIIKTLTVHD